MVCITLIDTKETQRLKEILKNQVKHEWFYPTATFRGLFVRTYNNDTWLKALKPTIRLKYPSLTAVYR